MLFPLLATTFYYLFDNFMNTTDFSIKPNGTLKYFVSASLQERGGVGEN